MSREMRDFAAAFSRGIQMGTSWAAGREAQAIARERNKLTAAANAARDARENRRLGYYGQQVADAGVLARARAQAALRPKGGGAAGSTPADVTALLKEANEQGIITSPLPAAQAQPIVNVVGTEAADAPVGGPPAEGLARGGMVKGYSDGGIAEGAGMSIGEALSYGKKKSSGGGDNSALAGNIGKAVEHFNKKDEVKPSGPQGTGAGGSYTVADTQAGGVLDTSKYGFRQGGTVRKFQSGGRVMEAAIDTGTSGPGSGYGYRAAPPARRY